MSIEYIKIPLEMDRLQDIIKNKGTELYIDYNGSKPLHNTGFLSYVSNLGIVARIDISSIDTKTLAELLQHYMTSKQLVICEELNILHMAVLYRFIGIDTSKIVDTEIITDEFLDFFVGEYKELLTNEFVFLSSLIGYAVKIHDDGMEQEHDYSIYQGTINDTHWVGTNIVNLISIPSFLDTFYSVDDVEYPLFYFMAQFETNMFNGNNLFHYFHEDVGGKNWLLGALHIAHKDIGSE